jgi:solute carrier family 25 protein 42
VNNHGPLALWRGNLATLIKVVPYSALTYATFDMYERAFSTVIGETNFWSRFLGGAAAGATATTATYPLDLIRARMAARWAIKPMSYGKTIAGVWKGRPTVTAFYAGLTPSLLGIFP